MWDAVRTTPDALAAASALFHQAHSICSSSRDSKASRASEAFCTVRQVLIGAASVDVATHSRHCHYGLVAALIVLARHSLAAPSSSSEGQNFAALAMRLLGGFSALDFLEDSAWPLSALAGCLVDRPVRSSMNAPSTVCEMFTSLRTSLPCSSL